MLAQSLTFDKTFVPSTQGFKQAVSGLPVIQVTHHYFYQPEPSYQAKTSHDTKERNRKREDFDSYQALSPQAYMFGNAVFFITAHKQDVHARDEIFKLILNAFQTCHVLHFVTVCMSEHRGRKHTRF